MICSPKRLSKRALNMLFLRGLGERVHWHSGEDSNPLLVDLSGSTPFKLRVYLFNCTNPPGGRALDEYKFQVILPGQQRGERASLDYSGGRMPIIAAYVNEGKNGVFVLWDADKHDDFAYSANMQVKAEVIIKALCSKTAQSTRNNGEIIVAARTDYIFEAIKAREEIMKKEILGGGGLC